MTRTGPRPSSPPMRTRISRWIKGEYHRVSWRPTTISPSLMWRGCRTRSTPSTTRWRTRASPAT
jgi:hypothetical protein